MRNDVVTRARQLEDAVKSEIRELTDAGDYGEVQFYVPIATEVASVRARLEARLERQNGTTLAKPEPAGGYHRFFVTEQRLIMVGKGRRGTSQEYRHELPRESVAAILEHLADIARDGQTFSAGQLVAWWSPRPSYHIYTLLSALRTAELVEMERRGSYRVQPSNLKHLTVSALWATLGNERSAG